MQNTRSSTRLVPVAVAAVVENMSELDVASPKRHAHALRDLDAIDRAALRILITLRRAERVLGGHWELPGGKIEDGERAEDAVVRELREEVGLDITPVHALPPVDHAYEHARVRLLPFVCRRVSGVARPIEVDDLRWVRLDELSSYRFPEASRPVIASLIALFDDAAPTTG